MTYSPKWKLCAPFFDWPEMSTSVDSGSSRIPIAVEQLKAVGRILLCHPYIAKTIDTVYPT